MDKDYYIVSVPRVPGVSRARMQGYIQEAVSTWGGQFCPVQHPDGGDPLGPPCVLMKRGAVRVRPVRRRMRWVMILDRFYRPIRK